MTHTHMTHMYMRFTRHVLALMSCGHTDTKTYTHIQRHTHRYKDIHTDTKTYTQIGTQIQRHTHRYKDIHTYRHTDTKTYTQIQRHTHR